MVDIINGKVEDRSYLNLKSCRIKKMIKLMKSADTKEVKKVFRGENLEVTGRGVEKKVVLGIAIGALGQGDTLYKKNWGGRKTKRMWL